MDINVNLFEHRIKTLEATISSNQESHQRIFERIEALEKDSAVNLTQYSQIMQTLAELKADIKEIKEGKEKRHEILYGAIAGGVIGAIVSIISSVIGG